MKIACLGDIMIGDQPLSFGFGVRSKLQMNKKIVDQNVIDLLDDFDLVLGNLESPVCNRLDGEKNDITHFSMRGDNRSSPLLNQLGLDGVNLANNHILEHGIEIFEQTCANLEKLGIFHFGSRKKSVHYLEYNGINIAILGWSMIKENYLGDDDSSEIYNLTSDPNEIIEEIRIVRKKVDKVILSLHWGYEFMIQPSNKQIELGRKFVREGADLIIGHHPHVLQPVEYYNKGIIAYSLGNFIFDYWMEVTNNTGILEINLENMKYEFHNCIIDKKTFRNTLSTSKAKFLPELIETSTNQETYTRLVYNTRKVYRKSAFLHFISNFQRYHKRSLAKLSFWGFKRLIFIFKIRRKEKTNPEVVYLGPAK
jgi:poly-gamma-glutamate synthesis protein (capsule biosynthesis protein)